MVLGLGLGLWLWLGLELGRCENGLDPQTVIIFKLFIYDYAIKLRILDGFLKLNSTNHSMVKTLRHGAADGIGTVMQGFESRPTRAVSGRFRTAFSRTHFELRLIYGHVSSRVAAG